MTCAFCGSENHIRLRQRVVEPEIPPPPIESPGDPAMDISKWAPEQILHDLIHSRDPKRRLELANAVGRVGSWQQWVVWFPTIAQIMVKASRDFDETLDRELGRHLAAWARSRHAEVRTAVRRACERHMLPPDGSKGLLHAFASLGPTAVKGLLDVAEGSGDYAATALAAAADALGMATDEEVDSCFDILLYRYPYVPPGVCAWILKLLSDSLTCYNVTPFWYRKKAYKTFLVLKIARVIDEILPEDPKVVPALVEIGIRAWTPESDEEFRNRLSLLKASESNAAKHFVLRTFLQRPDLLRTFAREQGPLAAEAIAPLLDAGDPAQDAVEFLRWLTTTTPGSPAPTGADPVTWAKQWCAGTPDGGTR